MDNITWEQLLEEIKDLHPMDLEELLEVIEDLIYTKRYEERTRCTD